MSLRTGLGEFLFYLLLPAHHSRCELSAFDPPSLILALSSLSCLGHGFITAIEK